MRLKPDTIHDELERQPLAAFTAMGGPGEDTPFINANLYGRDLVRIRMRSPQMDMTREQFLAFCRDGIRALERIGK